MSKKEYMDSNGLLYLWTRLKAMLFGKVDKVDGKQLSTEDYTTPEKTKLSALEGLAVSNEEPTNEYVNMWVDTTEYQDITYVPEIRDEETSSEDTWSSQKISQELTRVENEIPTEEKDPTVPHLLKQEEGIQTKTGNPVQIEMLGHLPLEVSTVLLPKQSGSGDPYPAGGGKNLFYVAPQTVDGITVSKNADGSYILNGTAASLLMIRTNCSYPEGTYILSSQSLPQGVYVRIRDAAGTILSTNNIESTLDHMFTGVPGICEFTIAAGTTLNNVVIKSQLEKGGTVTDWEPYSNIRPITGWDELELTRCGDNLLNYEMWQYIGMQHGTAIFENNGVTITALEDDAYTNDGLGFEDVENTYLAKIPVNPGESITLSWEADRSYSANIYIFPNADISKLVVCNNNENRPLVYTATEGVSFVTIRFSATKAGDVISYRNIMVNKGTEAMPFKPWQGEPRTVQIGDTVYGGHYNWLTGKLVAEWAAITLTGNEDINTYQQHEYLRFNVLLVVSGILSSEAANLNLVCSHYTVSPEPVYSNVINNTICSYLNYGDLYIRDDAHASVEEYKAWLAAQYAAGTPVQIAYKLAEPYTIQLEALGEITSLRGINTLYGDGEITVSGKTGVLSLIDHVKESAKPVGPLGTTYSTEEVKTNDIWIDGKPIYRRTFTGNSGADKAGKAIGNIPDLDMVVDFRGSVTVADYNLIEPIPSYRATTNALWHGVYFLTTSKNVSVASSFSEGAFFRLTVYYTKTTD